MCNLEVIYNGKSRLLQGWLRKEGEDEITLWEIKIPQGSPEEALAWYVGVTGATGGLWQKVSASAVKAPADNVARGLELGT